MHIVKSQYASYICLRTFQHACPWQGLPLGCTLRTRLVESPQHSRSWPERGQSSRGQIFSSPALRLLGETLFRGYSPCLKSKFKTVHTYHKETHAQLPWRVCRQILLFQLYETVTPQRKYYNIRRFGFSLLFFLVIRVHLLLRHAVAMVSCVCTFSETWGF